MLTDCLVCDLLQSKCALLVRIGLSTAIPPGDRVQKILCRAFPFPSYLAAAFRLMASSQAQVSGDLTTAGPSVCESHGANAHVTSIMHDTVFHFRGESLSRPFSSNGWLDGKEYPVVVLTQQHWSSR